MSSPPNFTKATRKTGLSTRMCEAASEPRMAHLAGTLFGGKLER
ncbi:hypothetical protein DSBG_1738 [Desulfosporosinus sp. BG]|nr:hypothetical protein DSBG_1738 [Desulfosporosinus sp. BG]